MYNRVYMHSLSHTQTQRIYHWEPFIFFVSDSEAMAPTSSLRIKAHVFSRPKFHILFPLLCSTAESKINWKDAVRCQQSVPLCDDERLVQTRSAKPYLQLRTSVLRNPRTRSSSVSCFHLEHLGQAHIQRRSVWRRGRTRTYRCMFLLCFWSPLKIYVI